MPADPDYTGPDTSERVPPPPPPEDLRRSYLRQRLQGSLLGDYLETRDGRYLLALALVIAAVLIAVSAAILARRELGDSQSGAGLWQLVTATGVYAAGMLAGRRYLAALAGGILAAVMGFVWGVMF